MSAEHCDRHYFPGTDCVECLRERETVLLAAHREDAQRIATIADEAFGPFPVQTCDENLTAIEHGIFGLRQRIGRLEDEREAVADVASEGDVEDLLDALSTLASDTPGEWEAWQGRRRTAKALHDAWQDERQRRGQAEQDAERWHRLFDEGATAIHAMQERLVAACERMGAAEADHARLVEAAKAARRDTALLESVAGFLESHAVVSEYRSEGRALAWRLRDALLPGGGQ